MSDPMLLHSTDAYHHCTQTQEIGLSQGKRKDKIFRIGLGHGGDRCETPGPFSNSACSPLSLAYGVTNWPLLLCLITSNKLPYPICLSVHHQPIAFIGIYAKINLSLLFWTQATQKTECSKGVNE